MDITGKITESPLSTSDIDARFDLLLQSVKALVDNPLNEISSRTILPIVISVSDDQHRIRIQLSRLIEEFITSWQPGDSTSRLRYAILAGLGLLNATTERGIKSITRRLDGFFKDLPANLTQDELLITLKAIVKFYSEYPNEFDLKYLEEVFRSTEPSLFIAKCSLATIMLGANKETPGRLRLTDVVDTIFSAADASTTNPNEKRKAISTIVHALPTRYWSQHLYRLDDTSDTTDKTQTNRYEFLRYFLLTDPPVLAIFDVDSTTYIVRPSDLLQEYEQGKSVSEAIKSCADRLREPIQVGIYADLESGYQDIIDGAMERTRAWQRSTLTADVIPLADYQAKRGEAE